ncbi:MAG TPA: GspH/FimT family pseudopilin [Phycisphaerae bacterium]|nr:GspH/FimT family pseudopilin [Phycisphaerae bacterium]
MRRGLTLVELLMVLLILAIAATIGMDALANTEAGLRADRAAREAVTAIKYARTLSVTTGGTYGVEFNTATAQFQVFQTTGSNVVPQPMNAGGTYVVKLSQAELAGTTITVSLTGLSTNPYDLTYAPLGTASSSGTVVFSCAGVTKTVTIPAVGDPTIQ